MGDRSCGLEDGFSIALHELDSSKAFLGKMRFALNSAVRDLAHGCSSDRLDNFAVASRSMNQATERYHDAVGAFNLACRVSSPAALPSPLRIPSRPLRLTHRIAGGLKWLARQF